MTPTATLPPATDPPRRVGRFELRRELGRGAQATVWLGWDAKLEREVAVKLMEGEINAVDAWLQEARSVSRLSHPHIVPVFDAGRHGSQPFLVFEYVAGPTLTQLLRQRGALPPHEAVVMLLGVLEALAAAHAAGVVHRDLKPSNILVDASGRARVMDFGIAARVDDARSLGDVMGTPGYMSPEAVNGHAPSPAMDVFSAGLVLGEMLCGHRLITERDPVLAMQRTVGQAVRLPDSLPAAVDDPLRLLLGRALERDPARRWPSAQAFHDALQHWLAPPASAAEGAAAGGANGSSGAATLEFLLRRMRHKTDFPALSDSVSRIRKVTSSDNESLATLSTEVLKDVALTNKLLRMVNSAHFMTADGGGVSTVSRAVQLLGFNTVRDLAMSLVLLEHMHDKDQAGHMVEEFLRALMAGTLAAELGQRSLDGEEAFVAAMFQNLGRLLTEYYFAEEARQVRGLVAATLREGQASLSEDAASIRVLGISFEDLGLGVARCWGLPDTIRRCMRRTLSVPPASPSTQPGEQLRWLSMAANDITDALLRLEPTAAAAQVAKLASEYARVLGMSPSRIEAATVAARLQVSQLATAMNLHAPAASAARRLIVAPPATRAAGSALAPAGAGSRAAALPPAPADGFDATVVNAHEAPGVPAREASALLSSGIQKITNSMVDSFKLDEVLRMILDTIHRALGARRVLFCLRDPQTDVLTGRFGVGEGAAAAAAAMRVPLKQPTDLFAAVCLKNADTLVSDATVPQFAARLPGWYAQGLNAPAFLLLPMAIKGRPFALIYADHASPGGIHLGDNELGLVCTLRNQALMAFKQSS